MIRLPHAPPASGHSAHSFDRQTNDLTIWLSLFLDDGSRIYVPPAWELQPATPRPAKSADSAGILDGGVDFRPYVHTSSCFVYFLTIIMHAHLMLPAWSCYACPTVGAHELDPRRKSSKFTWQTVTVTKIHGKVMLARNRSLRHNQESRVSVPTNRRFFATLA